MKLPTKSELELYFKDFFQDYDNSQELIDLQVATSMLAAQHIIDLIEKGEPDGIGRYTEHGGLLSVTVPSRAGGNTVQVIKRKVRIIELSKEELATK
jgi:hypothetical protein